MEPTDFEQPGVRIRCGWGEQGLRALAPNVDHIVVVDVLSFCTACAVAREQGAVVVPHDPERPLPEGVLVAGPRSTTGPSLSPASLRRLQPGTRLVLPSPNGSRLSARCRDRGVEATTGCLRDRASVVARLADVARIGLVAAGERWPDGSLRFALEDWLGVGAIAAGLDGTPSPEVVAARTAFEAHAADLPAALRAIPSGRELVRRGFADDVELAAALDVGGA